MAVTEATRRAELERGRVLVDFYAQWCGPCKAFAPTFEALAERYGGRTEFCRVDVDAAPELARAFQIMSVPTLVLLEDGAVKTRLSGAKSEEELIRLFALEE